MDKVKETRQYLNQKAKYVGVGNPDTSREEFITNIHRDTFASFVMHDNLLAYNAVAMNTHPEIVRQNMIKKMADPLKSEKD